MPIHELKEQIARLPEQPGVYLWLNRAGDTLYVSGQLPSPSKPADRAAGTPAQKADLIPKLLGGEVILCLGYSEPSCGSDVAAARTRAVRDGAESG